MDKYPICKNGKKQSPINIDTSTFDNFKNRCDVDCKLAVSYQPSDCHIINEKLRNVSRELDSHVLAVDPR